jgi:hypothetical protein
MWAGHPGAQKLDKLGSNQQVEVWTKPLGGGRTAALFINTAEKNMHASQVERGAARSSSTTAGGGGLSLRKCDPSKPSQVWQLNTGGGLTLVKSAGPSKGCWEITGCRTSVGAGVGTGYGCKALPKDGCGNACVCNGAWTVNDTVRTGGSPVSSSTSVVFRSVMDGACLRASGSQVDMGPCSAGDSKQHFMLEPVEGGSGGGSGGGSAAPSPPSYQVAQGGLCVDDGAKPGPPKPVPPP